MFTVESCSSMGRTVFHSAFMDSVITIQRTAAATAVAAKYLARPDSHVVTICGTGTQGRAQLRFLKRVLPIERVHAFGRREESVARYAGNGGGTRDRGYSRRRSWGDGTADDVIVMYLAGAAPGSGADVARGTFVAAVGSDNPYKQELQPGLVASSILVADLLEQCARVGSCITPWRPGSWAPRMRTASSRNRGGKKAGPHV